MGTYTETIGQKIGRLFRKWQYSDEVRYLFDAATLNEQQTPDGFPAENPFMADRLFMAYRAGFFAGRGTTQEALNQWINLFKD